MIIKVILKSQLIIMILLVVICMLITKSNNSVLSVLMGSFLIITLTILTYWLILKNSFITLPEVAIKKHKKGLIYKFFINIIAFLLIYKLYKNCDYLWLFIGYIFTQMSFWLTLLFE
jgi:hypothetical protein